ncbi:hypothetical protein ACSYDW_01785 [Paeniglutamicibacter sp. R2-26]|uniref:hypothetical protein n=1 Tax=Paeniglutamicibacter sp. R2-26 TaxID=3144417 RepID=UPI003EE7CFF3
MEPSGFMPDTSITLMLLVLIPVLIVPRPGIWVAFLAVQVDNIVATSLGLEPRWWFWASSAVIGAAGLIDMTMGMRQFMALRKLRHVLDQGASDVLPLTEEQATWGREDTQSGRGAFVFLACTALAAYLAFSWFLHESRTSGPEAYPEPFDPFLLAVALAAALWAGVLPLRFGWRRLRASLIGPVLWILPTPDGGPLSVAGMDWLDAGGLPEAEQQREGCSCAEDSAFTEEHSGAETMDEVSVDRHGAVHGVDVVNAMGTAEFAAAARTASWVWSPLSGLPVTAMGRPIGVLGYAGPGLPGRAGLVEENGFLAVERWRGEPAENHLGRGRSGATRTSESDGEAARKPAPMAGRIDELDLRPFGIDGFACRYKHGHPIFVPVDQRGNKTSPNSGQP